VQIGGELALDGVARFGLELGGDQIPDGEAQPLVAGVAGDGLAGLVDPGEAAREVVRIDDVARVLDELPVVRVDCNLRRSGDVMGGVLSLKSRRKVQ
jgi:hypothetical protein